MGFFRSIDSGVQSALHHCDPTGKSQFKVGTIATLTTGLLCIPFSSFLLYLALAASIYLTTSGIRTMCGNTASEREPLNPPQNQP